jgi:type IV pilus assembly protein PilM
MARSGYVWAIDIGRCGLKALRCRAASESGRIVAESADYIEYPMMLTQPEADATELVRQALDEFLGRYDLSRDKVAVSVPGSSGLVKFIKLPPIEVKKVPDIVRYEAKQQIPFPLEQVVWDWQRLSGEPDESGFVFDAEVAIFAMKREQVFKALAPLEQAGIEVDILQLTPVALANMLVFDQLSATALPKSGDAAADDEGEGKPSVVLVSVGVDSTDVVVTNGTRIWQRSMPIGGNAFTRALVGGMKLTFAKAEQLKRNVVRSEDPKAVFKTMRPVFNDFASELQRTLNYFNATDRSARIGKVWMLGSAAKLKGLGDFVAKQLQLDVEVLDAFRCLEGPATAAPAFRENRVAFGTAYGLAVQAVGTPAVRTNLLPPAILMDRLIESKKPVAAMALMGLLLASVVAFVATFLAWGSYAPNLYAGVFSQVESVTGESKRLVGGVQQEQQARDEATATQRLFVQAMDRRFQAIDLFRAIAAILPADDPENVPENPADRNELHIDSIDCEWFPDLAGWFAEVQPRWLETHPDEDPFAEGEPEAADGQPNEPAADGQVPPSGEAATGDAAATAPVAPDAPSADVAAQEAEPEPAKLKPSEMPGPTGAGWVIQLVGHHFHNEPHHKPLEAAQFVRATVVRKLMGEAEVTIAAGPLKGTRVPIGELGIGYPVILESSPVRTIRIKGMGGGGGPSAAERPGNDSFGPGLSEEDDQEDLSLRRYDFVLQFSWQPRVPGSADPAGDEPNPQ